MATVSRCPYRRHSSNMALSSGHLVTSTISPRVGKGVSDCWKTKVSSLPCTGTYCTRPYSALTAGTVQIWRWAWDAWWRVPVCFVHLVHSFLRDPISPWSLLSSRHTPLEYPLSHHSSRRWHTREIISAAQVTENRSSHRSRALEDWIPICELEILPPLISW